MRTMGTCIALMAMVGCAATETEGMPVAGSLLVHGESALVADRDNGELVQVSLTSGAITSCPVGLEPARLVQLGDVTVVSLMAEDALVAVRATASGCDDVARVEVGVEPWGVAASKAGDAVYAAVQGSGHVVEVATDGWTVERKIAVPGRPRWVTAHPNGHMLFVGTVFSGAYLIDLREQEPVPVPINAPEVERGDEQTGDLLPTTPRVTGDLAVRPDGGQLAIPMLYVEHTAPVDGDDPEPSQSGGSGGGYAAGNNEQGGLTRFNPAVVTFDLSAAGRPTPDSGVAMLVAGRVSASVAMGGRSSGQALELLSDFDNGTSSRGFGQEIAPRMDTGLRFDTGGSEVPDEGFRVDPARGYLTELHYGSEGNAVYAAVEGADMVAIVPAQPVQAGIPFGDLEELDDPFFGDGSMVSVPAVLVHTGAGSTGLALTPEGAVWSYAFIDRTLHAVEDADVNRALQSVIVNGAPLSLATWSAPAVHTLGPSLLSPDVQYGRRLFYSASHPNMTTAGAGVSCATCHFDGRNDGLTWTFDIGPRQTPSLAGRVSATAPVTWTNGVDGVATEASLTSQGRMGGHGITAAQTDAIAAFVDFTPPARTAAPDAEAVARGQVVFQRADTACSTCHGGEAYTDNESWSMHGLSDVNTPTLVGIGATGPYLHDGAAGTLRELVDMADAIGMGSTRALSDRDKDDLVAFLQSL